MDNTENYDGFYLAMATVVYRMTTGDMTPTVELSTATLSRLLMAAQQMKLRDAEDHRFQDATREAQRILCR